MKINSHYVQQYSISNSSDRCLHNEWHGMDKSLSLQCGIICLSSILNSHFQKRIRIHFILFSFSCCYESFQILNYSLSNSICLRSGMGRGQYVLYRREMHKRKTENIYTGFYLFLFFIFPQQFLGQLKFCMNEVNSFECTSVLVNYK